VTPSRPLVSPVIDQHTQSICTDERIEAWLQQVRQLPEKVQPS
jgi:hypothetical protein